MKRYLAFGIVALSIMLGACSSEPEPVVSKSAPPKAAPAPPEVPDHTSLFPLAGQVKTAIVPDHLLGMKAIPGGSTADYEVKGTKYQMFIIDADSAQKAAFMMLDIKNEMAKDPEYLSYMGGYFGAFQDQPFYVFSKLHYVAGLVGLPKVKADALARSLAAQLH